MDLIKKNFGFGCMRLPMKGDEVDLEEFSKMIELFIKSGFNYFDTAHGYIGGRSEKAIKECLTSKYKRSDYLLTNKLTNSYFKSNEDIIPFFNEQLDLCGVTYFDFYLMHAQNKDIFAYFKKHKAYETALKLKEEGKIRHLGISFHDKASVLEQILIEYPQIEVVQIQFNYADYEDDRVESRKCYEVCRKYNKPIMVMEPVKGGRLVNLPSKALDVYKKLNGGTPASYAIRFAAMFEGVIMVLSGMSNLVQMEDNLSYMKDFKPLDSKELEAVGKVQGILEEMSIIPCTACGYCVEGCPKHIMIPDLFSLLINKRMNKENTISYSEITKDGALASNCIKCGKCEKICPQQLPIRKLLEDVSKEFEV